MFNKDILIIISKTVDQYHSTLTIKSDRINSVENSMGFYDDFDYSNIVNYKFVNSLPKSAIKLVLNFSMLPLHPNLYIDDQLIFNINNDSNTYLWLFSPHEATIDFDILLQTLKDKKINPRKVIVSNNSYLYHKKRVNDILFVCIKDWWETYYKFHIRVFDQVSFITPEERLEHIVTARKKFLSLNRNVKSFRIWNYYAMIKTGVIDQGHVSYHLPYVAYKDKLNFVDVVSSSAKFFEKKTKIDIVSCDKLYKTKNLDLLDTNHIINYKDKVIPYYNDSLTSIVSESLLDHNFITEKTFKAITHSHPFIVVGHKDIQKRLRSIGYKTFEELFDADGIYSLEKAIHVYRHLKDYNINDIKEDILNKYMSLVDYNYNHFMNRRGSFKIHLDDIINAAKL